MSRVLAYDDGPERIRYRKARPHELPHHRVMTVKVIARAYDYIDTGAYQRGRGVQWDGHSHTQVGIELGPPLAVLRFETRRIARP